MRKILLFVFFIILGLSFSRGAAASDVGTKFQMYVPANGITVGYYVAVFITAIDDSTYFTLTDDNADGDNDDSYNGFLRQGETYIRYIKDGSVNDDAGGKWDGDYFILNSNKPVIFGQFTKGDYSHDWALSTNGTPKGKQFYIFTPQSLDSPRDINVFAYENSTSITLKDITQTTQNSTGIAKVNLNSTSTKFSTTLNANQELINIKTNGRNILSNGRTYMLTANKDVTVQYGTLYVSARDGGAYVPGSTGSCLGTNFTFAVPSQYAGEQEVRIMSYNNGVTATLQRINSSGSWVTLGTYNLNQYKYAQWFAGSSDNYNLFRVTVTGGKVSVFEGNWFETGSGTPATFDDFTYTPTNAGNKPGKEFIVYMMPPSDEDDNVDPFTGLKFRQLTSDGKFSHVYLYTAQNTSVRVRDASTNGSVIDTTFNISAGRYFDYRINTTKYNSLTSGTRDPYLYFVSTQPVVACQASWNDNWMAVASSMNSVDVTIGSDFNPDSVYSGSNSVLTGYIKNDGADFSTRKLVVNLPDGLTYVTSNLRTSSGNVGGGTVANLGNGLKTVTWTGFTFALGDSNSFTITVKAENNYFNGQAIANGTEFSGVSVFTGTTAVDTSTVQSSAVLKVKNSNAFVVNEDYLVAFEDLKSSSWNDWEVNDWVAGVKQSIEADSLDRIKKITFRYEALARGSSFDHTFYQTVNITGNSTVSLSVLDTNGNAVPSWSFSNQSKTGAFTTTIFPSTKQALPAATGLFSANTFSGQSYMKKGYTATLTITLNNTSNLLSSITNSTFDPYITTQYGNTIHIASIAGLTGNTQNVDNNVVSNTPLYGYFLDLGYKVPYDWKWPLEGPAYPIWISYPEFVNYIQSGKLLSLDWYDFPDENKVWQRRTITAERPKRTLEELQSEQQQHKIDELQKQTSGTSVFIDSIDKFFSSPKLADINGDGTLEVLLGSVDTKFYALDNQGNDMPGFPIPTAGIVRSTAAVDTSYKGLTIIVFGSDDGYLYAVTSAGKSLPGFPVNTGGSIKSSPMIVDFRNDGNKYIIVFSGNGMLSAYNLQGQMQSGFPKQIQQTQDVFGSLLILPSPAAADLFSDGSREIIVGTVDSALYVISPTGDVLQGFPVRLDNTVYSSPVVAQYSDNTNKIIVATGGGYLYVINRNGTIYNQVKLGDEIISSPVIADIDNDGTKEIIAGTVDGFIYCLDAESLTKRWEFETVAEVLSSPIIADLNGDEYLEVIVPSMIGRTLILDRFGVVDASNANLVTIFDSWIISGPAIGDIDNNGKLDLVLASFDKTVRAFEMTNTNSESKVVWGSFGYNLGNTRWNESDYIPPDQPNELGKIFNYPNPVTTERTTIRAELPLNVEEINLKIFDIGGELVKELSKKDFIRNGIYWDYAWDLQNGKNVPVANGVYIFIIEAKLNGVSYKKNQKMGVAR